MGQIVLQGVNGTKLIFDVIEQYVSVSIEQENLSCKCRDFFWDNVSELKEIFEEISKEWKGWEGEKTFHGLDDYIYISFRHNKKSRVLCDYKMLNTHSDEDDADYFEIKGTLSFEIAEFIRDFTKYF